MLVLQEGPPKDMGNSRLGPQIRPLVGQPVPPFYRALPIVY